MVDVFISDSFFIKATYYVNTINATNRFYDKKKFFIMLEKNVQKVNLKQFGPNWQLVRSLASWLWGVEWDNEEKSHFPVHQIDCITGVPFGLFWYCLPEW